MPRVVLGGLVGGMLAIAGASYQGVFRNPLVDPYLLGAAAGAGSRRDARVRRSGRSLTDGLADRPGADWRRSSVAVLTVGVTYSIGASFGGTRSA